MAEKLVFANAKNGFWRKASYTATQLAGNRKLAKGKAPLHSAEDSFYESGNELSPKKRGKADFGVAGEIPQASPR